MGQAFNHHGRQQKGGSRPLTGTRAESRRGSFGFRDSSVHFRLALGRFQMKARLWMAFVGVLVVSGSMVHASDTVTPENAGSNADVQSTVPKTAMFKKEKSAEKLREAFSVAIERVQEIPQCGGLFAELEADGLAMLTTTIYMPTHRMDEQTVCQTAAAFTWVGGAHTRLCRRFSSLSEERAAMTLIHEALHHAGLTEKPADPEAMTAREIDGMVGAACGRKSLKRELSARLER